MKPTIISTTVSVEFGDKEYGRGSSSFMNLTARYPEPGAPVEEIEDVMMQGLDSYFAAWKTLMAGRFAVGTIGGTEFKEHLAKAEGRIQKVRKYIKNEAQQEVTSGNE